MEAGPSLVEHEAHPIAPTHTWFRLAELANMWTHLIAFVVGLFAFHDLMHKGYATHNQKIILACGIYGICALFTFMVSAIYHALKHPRLKEIFHLLDHLLIYLMIAGTYTPFTLITLKGSWGMTLFSIIWGLAIFGIIFKVCTMGRDRITSTILYLFMGWIGVIAIVPIMEVLPGSGLTWLIAGGVIYTLGVIFYALESVPFAHTIWHFMVVLGAACQFICIYNYVL